MIVCTIEKANLIVNELLESQSLASLCCIVVDELHMCGDPERGYLLELLLTKLRYATAPAAGGGGTSSPASGAAAGAVVPSGSGGAGGGTPPRVGGLQIVGMSATLPNVSDIARWLGAALYVTDYRPIPLRLYLKDGDALYDPQQKLVRRLEVPRALASEAGHLALLCAETVADGGAVLVFCGTTAGCAATAGRIAALLGPLPERAAGPEPPPGVTRRQLAAALAREKLDAGSAELVRCIACGVAWHHGSARLACRLPAAFCRPLPPAARRCACRCLPPPLRLLPLPPFPSRNQPVPSPLPLLKFKI